MPIDTIDPGDSAAVTRASLNEAIGKANLVDSLVADQAGQTLDAQPGYNPRGFTRDTSGTFEDLTPLDGSVENIIVDSEGAALRIVGADQIALRGAIRLEPGRFYQARGVVRRRIDTPDPSNNTVQLALRWLNKDQIAVGSPREVNINDLLVSSGRTQISFIIASAAGAGVDYVWPASAVFARPYLKTFGSGDEAETDFELISLEDVTLGAPANVATLESRLGAIESEALPGRVEDLEALAAGSEIARFKTRTAAAAASIPAYVDVVETLGKTADADGQAGIYTRAVQPYTPTSEDFVSLDGEEWVLRYYWGGGVPNGSVVDDSFNQSNSELAAVTALLKLRSTLASPYLSIMPKIREVGVGPDDEDPTASLNGSDAGPALRAIIANAYADGIRKIVFPAGRREAGNIREYRFTSVDPTTQTAVTGRNGSVAVLQREHFTKFDVDFGGNRIYVQLTGAIGFNARLFANETLDGTGNVESLVGNKPGAKYHNGFIDLSVGRKAQPGSVTKSFTATGGQTAFPLNNMLNSYGEATSPDLVDTRPDTDYTITVNGGAYTPDVGDTITSPGGVWTYNFAVGRTAGHAIVITRVNLGGVNGFSGGGGWDVEYSNLTFFHAPYAPSGRDIGSGIGGDSGLVIGRHSICVVRGCVFIGGVDNGIYGNGASDPATKWPVHVLIEGNRFYRCLNAISYKNHPWDQIIQGNWFIECTNGVKNPSGGHGGTIRDNVFIRTQGVPISASGGVGTKIIGNTIRDFGRLLSTIGTNTDTAADQAAIALNGAEDSKVSDNFVMFDEWTATTTVDNAHRPLIVSGGLRNYGENNSSLNFGSQPKYEAAAVSSRIGWYVPSAASSEVIYASPDVGAITIVAVAGVVSLGVHTVTVPYPNARGSGRHTWRASHSALPATGAWWITAVSTTGDEVAVSFRNVTGATATLPAGTIRVWPDA